MSDFNTLRTELEVFEKICDALLSAKSPEIETIVKVAIGNVRESLRTETMILVGKGLPGSAPAKKERREEGMILNLSQLIKDLRDKKNWNAAKLAKESGVKPSIISRIESGKIRMPEKETLEKLGKALDFDFFSASADIIREPVGLDEPQS